MGGKEKRMVGKNQRKTEVEDEQKIKSIVWLRVGGCGIDT